MIRAVMIVEMAGRPAEHVKESLKKHVEILEQVKDVNVVSINVSEPREIEEVGDHEPLFTCFSEVEFETENFARLSETMFDFMPSSIEVLEPSKVSLDASAATDLLNNISGRMHRYDEVARASQVKVNHLIEQVNIAKKILEDKGIIKDGKLVDDFSKLDKKKTQKKKSKKKSTKKKTAKKKTQKKKSKK